LILKHGFYILFSQLQLPELHTLFILRTIVWKIADLDRWLKTVLPKKTKQRSRETKKKEPVVTTGSASNYEEWIPQHHLKKDTPKKRKGGKPTGSGNTST
jgi:hypothetical protein